ncbi:hypothetical protein [Acidithiobacillus ferrooxidans]|uniref:hypothetical protein n=1 Tax=Acidithiobacillus ferrooxidans TaxID=920 RepID=UPI000A806438|nr:hypothetical protein [Acidithiobacillus ferrooxidans]
MISRKITIFIRGETEADVEDAFNEAVDRLNAGCATGTDSNSTSGFTFENTDEVPPNEVPC